MKLLGENAAIAFGQDPSELQTLLQKDINADNTKRDQSTDIFGFSNHADNQGNRYSPIQYIHAAMTDAQQYNLTAQFNSLVSKVLFQNLATGVEPLAGGVEYLQGEGVYAETLGTMLLTMEPSVAPTRPEKSLSPAVHLTAYSS